MYCAAYRLAEIREQIRGKELKEVYPDWANGKIYFHFANISGSGTVILTIKNNYYAGIDILQSAEFSEVKNESQA